MKTQKLNLSSYGVTKMSDTEMRNFVGGWVWAAVGIGVAIYLALSLYAHENHH